MGLHANRVRVAVLVTIGGAVIGYMIAPPNPRLALFMAVAGFAIVAWGRSARAVWTGLAVVLAGAGITLVAKPAVLALPIAVCASAVSGRTAGRRWAHGIAASLVSIAAFAAAGAVWPDSLAPVVAWGAVTIAALIASYRVERR